MQKHLRKSLKAFGITGAWRIVLPHKPDPAERTAAKELKRLLAEGSIDVRIVSEAQASGKRCFLLGRPATSRPIKSLCDSGALTIATTSEQDDGYHLKRVEQGIVLAGVNARSVLYGVYRLTDWLAETGGRKKKLDLCEAPYFKQRWMAPGQMGRSDTRAGFRFLARMGVNTAYVHNHWGEPVGMWENAWELHHLVSEREHLPQVARLAPPRKKAVAMVDKAYRLASDWGMTPAFALLDPAYAEEIHAELPEQVDPDILTTPWPQRERGRCHSLCIFHPDVENHFRALVKKFVVRYPAVKAIYLYNEDLDTGHCYPAECPRCRKLYPKGYEGYPWINHLRQIEIYQEAAWEVRKDFSILTGTWHWEGDVRKEMIANMPSGNIVGCLNYTDCRTSVWKIPAWAQDVCRKVKARNDLQLFAFDDFNGSCEDVLMEIAHGFPLPYRIYKKMNAFAKAGVTGIAPHALSGPSMRVNAINDMAYRVFSWNPLMSRTEADQKIQQIALAQAGSKAAAAPMVKCWNTMDKVMDLWSSNELPRLLDDYFRGWVTTPIIPLRLKDDGNLLYTVAKGYRNGDPMPQRRLDFVNVGGSRDLMKTALSQIRQAVKLAPANQHPVYLWDDSSSPLTCREYVNLQAEAIEIAICMKESQRYLLEAGMIGEKTPAFVEIMKEDTAVAARLIELLLSRKQWIASRKGRRFVSTMISQLRAKKDLMDLYLE